MRSIALLSLFLLVAAAQNPPANSQSGVITVPLMRPAATPPPVTLQQALQIAEKYVTDRKIPIEHYWLRQVRWALPDGVRPTRAWEGSRWYFWWVNLNGAMGDYVELEVDMDGNVTRRPSM